MSKKLTGTALFITFDDVAGKFTFVIEGEDNEAYTVKLGTKSYDAESRSYFDDEAAYNRASEVLAGLNPDATVENAAMLLMGEEVTFYVAGENTSFFEGISENPGSGSSYTRFVKEITPAQSKMLSALEGPVALTIFEEFKGVRFNIGFKQEFKGEELAFRVSQLIIPADADDEDSIEVPVSVKYTNSEIEDYREQLKNGQIDESQASRFESAIEKLLERSRKHRAEQLKPALGGRDVLELLANPEPVLANITVNKFSAGNGVRFYLSAEVIG